ncbi:acetylxylan esterase [Jiangella sp. DSM 45060]|uniref:acetylxylan esterase n=1 Tax=Jiangella sp. DSM 45060 TaxID=1798224 RepID=UPI00087AC276|nr:acetylxylan esterase [Jiangella sp. DSM 45060]SDS51123.1 Alpha/beta hydrolase family protein [Jiangella sp. DSM 45060]
MTAAGGAGEETALRAWWTTWLGAVRDPEGTFAVDAQVPDASGVRRHTVRLTSYGSVLEAALVAPDQPGRLPAVVVPFYEVATVLGERTERTRGWSDARLRSYSYGRHLVDRGFAVLAVPWWFERVAGPADATASLHERYGPPAARHRASLPMTGLGRGVADLLLAVDALTSVPWIDPARIGAFGHSLGAKLVLHLAALDVRIGAAVAHEAGLGFAHSNWSDPWYLGAHVPAERDQDQLLRLVGRRPFLLAGGGDSDGRHNEDLVGRAGAAGVRTLYHDNGHAPPDHVLAACYAWLAAELDRPDPSRQKRNART